MCRFEANPCIVSEKAVYASALFPVGLNERSSRIESVLTFLGRLGTEEVVLLHVVGGEAEHAHRARSRLEEACEQITARGLSCRTMVRRGSSASVIVELARSEGLDFICVPWKRKSWLQRTLVGSVTTDVVRLADVPVLVHKESRGDAQRAAEAAGGTAGDGAGRGGTATAGTGTDTPQKLSGVLFATNFQATDASVVPYAAYCGRIARELHILNVRERAPDPAAEEKREREVQANLERLAGECSGEYASVEKSAVLGSPRRSILRYAGRNSIELIVLGKSDAPAPLAGMMGSTAEEVSHSARCSVLIVAPDMGGAP